MALELNDQNFEDLVLKSTQPVVVDFWAEWCGPCKMLAPVLDELARDYKGRAIVGKVNVDNSSAVSSKYNIMNIPTILFFKDGEVVDKQVGIVPKNVLSEKIDTYL